MRKILLQWFVKERDPFDTWQAILSKDLQELRQLQARDTYTRTRRSLKEQELGQHCCQAGESLDDADLLRLKEALGLTDQQWRSYRSNVRPAQE